MPRTGRKPFESTDVAPYGLGNRRLKPPPRLGEAERRAFLDLITTSPAGQFRASDLPLLCRYAEAVVTAEQASGEMAANGKVIDGAPSPWISVREKAVKELALLARLLRLRADVPGAASVEGEARDRLVL